MTIQLVDLKRQYEAIRPEIVAEICAALDSMELFLGPNVRAFESEFAEFCGAAHGIGVADGTSALYLALRALRVGPGDEVVTVSHTFIATVEAIVMTGATPVLVDVDPAYYTMDTTKVESALTSKTKAILPVHLYGHPADMEPIVSLARAHDIRVLEDASQAHGATYRGRPVGGLADAACFSLYYSKNLGAYGEAGIITTSDPDVAESVRMLRDHGSRDKYRHECMGVNGRLDEIQAAILRVKLRHLRDWNDLRRKHAHHYREALAGSELVLPSERDDSRHVHYVYAVLSSRRDALCDYLKVRGIATGVHYPVPVHRQPAFEPWQMGQAPQPQAERLAAQTLSLPMFPEIRDDEIEAVAAAVRDFDRVGAGAGIAAGG